MKKRNVITAAIILTFCSAFIAGCGNDDKEDYLEDKVEQLEQQVTDMENKDKAGSSSKAEVPKESADAGTDNTAGTDNAGGAGKAADYGTLQKKVDALSDKIDTAAPSGSTSEQRDQFYALKQELNDVEQQLDIYDDKLESQYKNGTMEASDYRKQEQEIDALEDILDTAEDKLELTFGIDD